MLVLYCLVISRANFEKLLSHRFKVASLLNFELPWSTFFAVHLIILMRMYVDIVTQVDPRFGLHDENSYSRVNQTELKSS